MTDPTLITFTVKELLQRLDERMGQLDQKLDLRLVQMDERITHVERTQSERQYLIEEHKTLVKEMESMQAFRARFLPTGVIAALVGLLALALDIYVRVT